MTFSLTKKDLVALYDLLENPRGIRRKDVAELLLLHHPDKSPLEARYQAGLILNSLHRIGAVFRNQWYYVLTDSGRSLKHQLEEQ